MKKSKLEKVLEYMVNGENELANEMLHEHIIESAREIYADLAEEDEAVEEELELDEDEDLDKNVGADLEEGHSDANKSGDFIDDLETMEDEIDAEDYFGEDDDALDDEGAIEDLEGEMGLDVDMGDELGDLDAETGDGEMDGGEADVSDAMVNVEDAMEELRAAFADIMGDGEMEVDDDMGDEVADEFVDGDDDMEDMDDDDDEFPEESFTETDEIEEKDLDEDAKLTNQSVTMAGDEDGKASPIKQNQPGMGDKGKAVNFAGGADEKGGKAASVKKLNVTGPQEQKGRMDKKVATPSNKSEKAKSNIGS